MLLFYNVKVHRELVQVARDKVFNILDGDNIITGSRPEFIWSLGLWWEQITKNMWRIDFNWTEEPFIRLAD